MPEYIKIACIGDSIANGYFDETGKGWVVRLIEKLNARKPYGYYLNNFARSGDRSCDAFHKLCSSVIPMRPDVLLISIGTNDLPRWNSPDNESEMQRGVIEEYWEKIIDVAKKNAGKVYISGLIPVEEKAMPFQCDNSLWWRNSDIERYNLYLSQLCRKHDLPFLDFYNSMTEKDGQEFLYDGLHPTTNGHERMAEFAFHELKDLI